MEYSNKLRKDIISFVVYLFERAKEVYEKLEKAKNDYKKIKYSLDNFYHSKEDFVKKIMSLKEDEKEEYKNNLKEYLDEKQIKELLDAANNYYQLLDNDLLDKEEYKDQKQETINSLDANYDISCKVLQEQEKRRLEEEIKKYTKEFEDIDSIGKCFNYGYETGLKEADVDKIARQKSIQIESIDNLHYLWNLIKEFDKPDADKFSMTIAFATNNVAIEEKKAQRIMKKAEKAAKELELLTGKYKYISNEEENELESSSIKR